MSLKKQQQALSLQAFQNAQTRLDLDKIEANTIGLTNPSLTYVGGRLVYISYGGGQTKTFNYTGDLLTSIIFFDGSITTTKTLNYTDGILTSITES